MFTVDYTIVLPSDMSLSLDDILFQKREEDYSPLSSESAFILSRFVGPPRATLLLHALGGFFPVFAEDESLMKAMAGGQKDCLHDAATEMLRPSHLERHGSSIGSETPMIALLPSSSAEAGRCFPPPPPAQQERMLCY